MSLAATTCFAAVEWTKTLEIQDTSEYGLKEGNARFALETSVNGETPVVNLRSTLASGSGDTDPTETTLITGYNTSNDVDEGEMTACLDTNDGTETPWMCIVTQLGPGDNS